MFYQEVIVTDLKTRNQVLQNEVFALRQESQDCLKQCERLKIENIALKKRLDLYRQAASDFSANN